MRDYTYTKTKKRIAFIILISHILTSCWNGGVPKRDIPIADKRIEQEQSKDFEGLLDDNTTTINDDSELPVFIAKQGHKVRFIDKSCTQAIVDENLPYPFKRTVTLKVKKQDINLDLSYLLEQNAAWHQNNIHIYFPERAIQVEGCVYIGNANSGLYGGGKGRKDKEKESEEEAKSWDRYWVLHDFNRTLLHDTCLKDKQAIDKLIDKFFLSAFSINIPVYRSGPKQGYRYTKEDFRSIVEEVAAYCNCSQCANPMPSSSSSTCNYVVGSSYSASSTFSNSTGFIYSGLNFLENSSSPNLISFMNQFSCLSILSSLPSTNNSLPTFKSLPVWTSNILYNACTRPDLLNTSFILPISVTRCIPAYTSTNTYNPLSINSIQSNNVLHVNPSASGISFAQPSTTQQILQSRPMRDLGSASVDLLSTIFNHSKQVDRYHTQRAEATIQTMRAENDSLMHSIYENMHANAVKRAQREEQERQEQERQRLEGHRKEEERLQLLIERRLALEHTQVSSILYKKKFISDYRSSNVEQIARAIYNFNRFIQRENSISNLSEKLKLKAKDIVNRINEEQLEISESVQGIRYSLSNPGAILSINFYKSEDLELANKLLKDLANYKKEFCQLLITKGEDLSDYEEIPEQETEEETSGYRDLEEQLNNPSDAVELVSSSQSSMQSLLEEAEGNDSKRQTLQPKAIQIATNGAEIVEILKSQYRGTEKLYFDSDTRDYVNRSILEGVQKMQFLRAGINTLQESLDFFCKKFVINVPNVPSFSIITKETLKSAFNVLVDLLVPGSALVKAVLGTNPLPQTPKEWASLAIEAGFDFIPCGKILKLIAGPSKPLLRNKIKGFIVKLLKKRRGNQLLGESFGKLGKAIKKPIINITEFSNHGLHQTITREIKTSTLLNTVRNPMIVLQQTNGNYLFLSKEAAVVINPNGKLVTSYAASNFDQEILNILKRLQL